MGLDELTYRYERYGFAWSDDRARGWLNWLVRRCADAQPLGYVQATVDDGTARLAWVIAVPYQREGVAQAAAGLMVGWLREQGVVRLTAGIHPEHVASMAVARSLGLTATGQLRHGEVEWVGIAGPPPRLSPTDGSH